MLQIMENFLCQVHSKTSEEICQFLIANRLIKDSMICNYCQQQSRKIQMALYECNAYPSRNHKKLKIGQLFWKISSANHGSHKYNLLVFKTTKTKWCCWTIKEVQKFRKKFKKETYWQMSENFVNNPIRLGGPGVVVQVDETKINFNVKSHRGLGNFILNLILIYTLV